jgi:hypothetical protein
VLIAYVYSAINRFFAQLSKVESEVEGWVIVGVQTNPYRYWEDGRENSDYRSRETQASSLTRQILRQPEYLLRSNRVNPGPERNLRARVADSAAQIPHTTCFEDVWGWQQWTETSEYVVPSPVSSNLLEQDTDGANIPGCEGTVES